MPKEDLLPGVQQQIIEDFKGDTNAFAQVYDFYFERIFRYLLKRTMSAETAYDLTADTFIKAFENFHKFQWTGISIKVWLYRIAINSLKNYRRRPDSSPLTHALEGHEDLVHDVKEELKEVDKALFGDDELSKLSDAIATLKPEYQNVISLYYFDGMSQQEISEAMNRSVSSVKSLMHRAMTSVRQILSANPLT